MLSSAATRSSSRSISTVKSTFTRWIGFFMLPLLVKYAETSSPRSAILAISSAVGISTAFFIELLFLSGRFPQGHLMIAFAFVVFTYFINQRIQTSRHPPDSSELLRIVRSAVSIVRMPEDLLRFFDTPRHGHAQSDRTAADVRLPARRLPERRAVSRWTCAAGRCTSGRCSTAR